MDNLKGAVRELRPHPWPFVIFRPGIGATTAIVSLVGEPECLVVLS